MLVQLEDTERVELWYTNEDEERLEVLRTVVQFEDVVEAVVRETVVQFELLCVLAP